jgi:hypothetical protein
LGKPCTSKEDCDVACSCASPTAPPGRDQEGPKDGTRGVTGHCAGTFAVGTWMCEIDEHGVVAHRIVE